MLGRLSHTRLLRAAGLYTWALVGIPIILNVWVLPPSSGTDGQGVNLPPVTMLARTRPHADARKRARTRETRPAARA